MNTPSHTEVFKVVMIISGQRWSTCEVGFLQALHCSATTNPFVLADHFNYASGATMNNVTSINYEFVY